MVDLGKSPLCESFLPPDRLETMEPFYPLHVRVCTECWLAQIPSFVPPAEIFQEYAYALTPASESMMNTSSGA